MLTTLCLVTMLAAAQTTKPATPPAKPAPTTAAAATKTVALPDTPQGRQVKAFIDAFNTGDEKAFLTVQDRLMSPELLKKRPADERATLFHRMRGDFGTLKVAKVIESTAQRIQLAVPTLEGEAATFTFALGDAAPHHITSLSVELQRRDRNE